MVMSLSRVLWKVHSKAPTVTASMLGTVLAAGEGYTTIRDSTGFCRRSSPAGVRSRRREIPARCSHLPTVRKQSWWPSETRW